MPHSLLPVLAGALAGAASALATATLLGPPTALPPAPSAGPDSLPSAVPTRPGGAADLSDLETRLSALSEELRALALRVPAAPRTPLPTPAPTPFPKPSPRVGDRAFVLAVLEEERQRERREAELAELERREQKLLSRANALAEELGLTSAERSALAEVLLLEGDRRRTDDQELDGLGLDGPDRKRWKRDRKQERRGRMRGELERRLGPRPAARVLEAWSRGGAPASVRTLRHVRDLGQLEVVLDLGRAD